LEWPPAFYYFGKTLSRLAPGVALDQLRDAVCRGVAGVVGTVSLTPRESQRAVRYDAMLDRTHGFLPIRNGIRPNTLHIILHTATNLTLVVLWQTRR
jgi:hypothetical protein